MTPFLTRIPAAHREAVADLFREALAAGLTDPADIVPGALRLAMRRSTLGLCAGDSTARDARDALRAACRYYPLAAEAYAAALIETNKENSP